MSRLRGLPALTAVACLLLAAASLASPATASDATHRSGVWVVSVGDSYIVGEAGRWAGNTNGPSRRIDALGPRAYDVGSGPVPAMPGCHRSASAPIHIGVVASANLACSGARTATVATGSGGITPGLDFYADERGNEGQARLLEEFAKGRRVRLVVVSIGGNDFGFGLLVHTCVQDFLSSTAWWPRLCRRDPAVAQTVTPANVALRTRQIRTALRNVHRAMARAGHRGASYTILVATYPSPLPRGAGMRYPQFSVRRQSVGGCGLWNADADWANHRFLPAVNGSVRAAAASSGLGNVRVLDLTSALDGRRLCERGVGLLEERNLESWTSPGAVDQTEWVSQIRLRVMPSSGRLAQESLHPNYWGQLAIRNCVRQAYHRGAPHGVCTRAGPGLTSRGEPVMRLR